MFQDGQVMADRAMARRQAFSTSTLSASVTSSSDTTASTTSPSRTTSGASSSLTFTPAIETLTNADSSPEWCTVALPSGGIIKFNDSYAITLEDTLSFQAQCGNNTIFSGNGSTSGNSTLITSDKPFYSSIQPQVYALAAATVVSYILVIILFITPRTFYVGGPGGSNAHGGGASGLLGRGLTLMGTGGTNPGVIGVGRRPMLQKIAAITVAISLTIATADTFDVVERQYNFGYLDSRALVNQVVGSTEVRVTRVISDAFLWLAQVQTLIRLFPRHKEKVAIKWLGFGLVICDTVFSILENFVSGTTRTRPETFTDAIPALSYLFEMAISLIYASCVIYYSLSKRRFAFWNVKMRSMCIMALLSLSAVLIPVVFFILDVVQPDIATWGEYIRWVGAAAASVVVWEWVERIEALERDEKKDGILGREVFDGDDMLENTTESMNHGGGGLHFGTNHSTNIQTEKRPMWKDIRDLNLRPRLPPMDWKKHAGRLKQRATKISVNGTNNDATGDGVTRPMPVATPISRADTTSASTVYAVRYHNPLSPSPVIPEEPSTSQPPEVEGPKENSDESTLTNNTTHEDQSSSKRTSQVSFNKGSSSGQQIWQSVSNPFKRKRTEPPAEVAAQIASLNMRRSPAIQSLRTRLNTFSSSKKFKVRGERGKTTTSPLQVTVIPAQPRGSRRGSRRESQLEQRTNDVVELSGDLGGSLIPGPGIPEIDEESSSQSDLHVTVIPPPKRGGRTWSPDDLYDPPDSSSTLRQHRSQTPSIVELQQSLPHTSSRNVNSTSGQPSASRNNSSLAQIIGVPGRSSNSPGSHIQLRSSGRERGPTITSISDRLNTSPNTISLSGRRPGIQDTTSGSTANTASKDSLPANVNATSNIGDTPDTQPPTHTQADGENTPQPARSESTMDGSETELSSGRIEPRTAEPKPP